VKRKAARKTGLSEKARREITGLLLLAAAFLLLLSFFASAGLVGDYLNLAGKWLFGAGRFLLPFYLGALAIIYFYHSKPEALESVAMGGGLIIIAVLVGTHLQLKQEDVFKTPLIFHYGGLIGAGLSGLLRLLIGVTGSYVLAVTGVLIGLVYLTGVSLTDVGSKVVNFWRARKKPKPLKSATKPRPAVTIETTEPQTSSLDSYEEPTVLLEKPQLSEPKQEPSPLPLEVTSDGPYKLPPLNLLKRSAKSSAGIKRSDAEKVAVLEQTLRDFDVDAKVEKVVKGPTVTRFELQLASGVKVNRIVNLADDIALALASADVRVLAPIPGRSAVGIEVPNEHRELVTLGDILAAAPPEKFKSPLTVAIGKDITGQTVLADLSQMPHLLIAGATGSGKSVCLNAILISLLLKAKPEQVKLILIDPKRIELNLYNDIPHLLIPVVTNPKEAATALSWAVAEMEARFHLLADAKVRNINSYNEVVGQFEDGREPLPYIVVVIDELADLMMVAAGEVEDGICRLAQMARAVGIHLVVATQRPSADVITGLIKANITARIAFSVSSQVDSRVVLDCTGAEKLVGKGDMLFLSPESSKPRRLQGAFVTESEVELVTSYVKKQAKPEYKREILEEKKPKQEVDYEDPLFDEALELIVAIGQASTSLLQRRLRIGYARAARLMDIFEQRGLIGPQEGSKARPVLITAEELSELRRNSD